MRACDGASCRKWTLEWMHARMDEPEDVGLSLNLRQSSLCVYGWETGGWTGRVSSWCVSGQMWLPDLTTVTIVTIIITAITILTVYDVITILAIESIDARAIEGGTRFLGGFSGRGWLLSEEEPAAAWNKRWISLFARERERQRETSVFRYASSQKASYDTYGMINHDGGSRRLVILSATLYILAKYAQKERKERKKEKKIITTIYTIIPLYTYIIRTLSYTWIFITFLPTLYKSLHQRTKKKKTTFLSSLVPPRSSSRIRSIGINFSSFSAETNRVTYSLTYLL